MPKQTVEIEIPEGYELVDYRTPKDGEFVLVNGEAVLRGGRFGEYPILKKTRVSLHKFYTDVIDYHGKNACLRYGQAMFQHLFNVNRELAHKIRGTNCDPFNCLNQTEPNFQRFIEFIESNWER